MEVFLLIIFHAFGLVRMVTGKVNEWYKNKHRLLQFTTTPLEHLLGGMDMPTTTLPTHLYTPRNT
jgi:hypothetical protein